jgi:enoyl-CoA hydratase/carnithine racemase
MGATNVRTAVLEREPALGGDAVAPAGAGLVGAAAGVQRLRLARSTSGVLTVELGSNAGAIVRAIRAASADSRNKVVILRGIERELALGLGATNSVLEALATLPAPVIAIVEADAHAHPEIALTADVVIAGESATFGYAAPLAARGSADDAIRALWRHRIGRDPAEAFLLSPWPLLARRAWAWTLVSEVVEPGDALRRAQALAELYLAASEATRRRLRAEFIAPVRRILAQSNRGDLSVTGATPTRRPPRRAGSTPRSDRAGAGTCT